jgi:L-Ala-D/L-Glu epimerase
VVPLVQPWIGATATMSVRSGALVAIKTRNGQTGWGDCAPLPSMGAAEQAAVLRALENAAHALIGRDIEGSLAALAREPCAQARWALETALLDAKARDEGRTLHALLSAGSSRSAIPINAALGPLDRGCAARAVKAKREGFSVLKIKVGLAPLDCEIAAMRSLAGRLGHPITFRLDANRAWQEKDAFHLVDALADLPIDCIEEPLAAPTPAALARLQATAPFAIAVDESLAELGLPALAECRSIRRLVVKPARIGSFSVVMDLVDAAARAGIETVLTSVIDTSVGVTAAAHLAAAMPPGPAHGLATLDWLAEDITPAPMIAGGMLRLPESPGLGVSPDKLAQS